MISCVDISKKYGNERVLDKIDFTLEKGNTLGILGKSGSGKSTLLKILAGLENADKGQFEIELQDQLRLPPEKRDVVYLSQEAFLFPHLNVFKNLSFGLEIRKIARVDIKEKVEVLASELGLTEHLSKYPGQLSGGQKQRVNFGRALIINPGVLLLDEPFASLDSQIRREMQDLFLKIKKQHSITSVFVTHDIREAIRISDEWALLKGHSLHVFPSLKEFMESEDTGVKDEIEFWKSLKKI